MKLVGATDALEPTFAVMGWPLHSVASLPPRSVMTLREVLGYQPPGFPLLDDRPTRGLTLKARFGVPGHQSWLIAVLQSCL